MLEYDASQMQTFKSRQYLLPERCLIKIRVPGGTKCTLTGSTQDGDFNLGQIKTDIEFVETLKLTGFKSLTVASTAQMTAQVIIATRQLEEPHDDAPNPIAEQPNNILAQIRQTVRREMGVQRESFMENDTGRKNYELDDDADDDFEEEIIEKTEQLNLETAIAKKKAAEAANSETIPTGDNNNPPVNSPNPEPSS